MIFTGGRNCSHQTAWNYVRDNLVCLRLAEGYTRSAIEQEVIDSNTGATANGSEPIKLVFDLGACEPAVSIDCSMGRVKNHDGAGARVESEVTVPAASRIAGMNADVKIGPTDN
jgi:hypothetical protein